MALIQDGRSVAAQQAVETKTKAGRVTLAPRGIPFAISGVTGTIAAALAANSCVFAARLDPGSPVLAFIERVRVQWTTIVAFTAAVTGGRRLALFRGSGAAASGGTAIANAARKDSVASSTEFDTAQGGDIRIATTGALTVTGITFETDQHRMMTLTHVGSAGAMYDAVWEFHASENAPLILQPGQLIGVRNPVAMDAGGTWQLCINIDGHQSVAWDSTTAD